MEHRRYSPESPAKAPPLYLRVNVYRAKSGWFVSTSVMQAGGPFPRSIRRLNTHWIAEGDQTLSAAARKAAEILQAAADDPDFP